MEIVLPEIQATRVIAVQAELLRRRYIYADAWRTEDWPAAPVLMASEDSAFAEGQIILIAPWQPVWHDELLACWAAILAAHDSVGGMLFVGMAPADSREIDEVFAQTRGTVAYFDLSSGAMRLQRRKTSLFSKLPPLFTIKSLGQLCEAPLLPDARAICSAALDAYHARIDSLVHFYDKVAHVSDSVNTPITFTLLGLSLAVFAGTLLSDIAHIFAGPSPASLLQWGALSAVPVQHGQWWRFITYAFLHGGFMHIFFNMMALLVLGSQVELWQGRRRFAAIIGVSAVSGGILGLWMQPAAVIVGFSGALFGLLGALVAILLRFHHDVPPALLSSMKSNLRNMLIINAVISLLPSISLGGHLGGFLGGFILTYLIGRSPTRSVPFAGRHILACVVLLVILAAWGYFVVHALPR